MRVHCVCGAGTWPQLHALLSRTTPDGRPADLTGTAEAERADVYFLGLGLHDTNIHRYEAYRTVGIDRWPPMPACWTHGRVLQPFLDHWCAALGRASRSPPPHATPHDAHHTSEPPALAVWITMNEQCEARKTRYKWQAMVATAANRASRAAASSIGLPLIDLAQLTPSKREACTTTATTDGVHVAQWVDLLRAQLLLSYLCDAHGHFRGPGIARGVAAAFDKKRARCRLVEPAAQEPRVASTAALQPAARGARRRRRTSPDLPASELDPRLLYDTYGPDHRISLRNQSCIYP